jgi:uncharacterized protein (DUF924 family)
MAAWQSLLDFWFLPAGDAGHGKPRPEWFRKDPAFDLLIRQRFGDAVARGLAGEFVEWASEPRGALARIILLDQFTRNIYRDTAQAFAGDARALAAARAMVDAGRDRMLVPVERWFVYLPFEHAEDMELQQRSVALFDILALEPGMEGITDYAYRHRDIIARFGRFPHRNRILGRESTLEEVEFLKLPGSGF